MRLKWFIKPGNKFEINLTVYPCEVCGNNWLYFIFWKELLKLEGRIAFITSETSNYYLMVILLTKGGIYEYNQNLTRCIRLINKGIYITHQTQTWTVSPHRMSVWHWRALAAFWCSLTRCSSASLYPQDARRGIAKANRCTSPRLLSIRKISQLATR